MRVREKVKDFMTALVDGKTTKIGAGMLVAVMVVVVVVVVVQERKNVKLASLSAKRTKRLRANERRKFDKGVSTTSREREKKLC